MSKKVVLRSLIGKLKNIKKQVEEKVNRNEVFKDGQQLLELSPAAFFIGLQQNSEVLNRIHSQVPESVSMSRIQLATIISDKCVQVFRHHRETMPRPNKKTPGLIDATPKSGFRGKHFALLANSNSTLYSWISMLRSTVSMGMDLNSRITSAYVSTGSEMHFGHLAGPAVEKNFAIQNRFNRLTASLNKNFKKERVNLSSGMFPAFVNTGIETIEKAIKLDARVNFNKSLNAKYGITSNMQVHIGIFEEAKANLSSGSATKSKIRELNLIIDRIIEELIDLVDIIESNTSKSTIDLIDDGFTAAFMDKDSTAYKSKSKQTAKKTVSKTKIRINKKRMGPSPTKGKIPEAKSPLPDYLKLQRQINAALHDTLKYDVMGKGRANELLNYRTGRFAESVKVTKIIPPVGKLRQHTINVNYMRNPYMVFSPGGHLYKPLRDPERLAGRAIRKIIKDEAISELSSHKTRVAY